MLDNQIRFETPESIELTLVPAGPIPRILAFGIDWVIRIILLILLGWLLSSLGLVGDGLYLILYFVLEWFYSVLFEMFNNGSTPGKKAMNIRVVHDDGTPLGWGASVMRNIMRAADFMPLAYISGILCMVSSNGFKRLGDHVAATLVVYNEQSSKIITQDQAGSRQAPFLLELEEQQAILAFTERSAKLSQARLEELADILTPVLPDMSSQERVQEIKKIANGIIGSA